MAMASSPAAMVLLSGVLTTMIPFSVQASTSMLSMPLPARPATLSLTPRSISSRFTFVTLRTMMAS